MSLPNVDELFTLFKGAKYITALDLCSGYYHITLEKESIPKSTFTTVCSKLQFLALPFGLSQGPDFFTHLTYDLFGLDKTSNLSQGSGHLAYLDDILTYSKTKQEHLEMLNNAFKHICKASLKIKLSKCLFFKEQIHYLGHLVCGASILPLTNKIEALIKLKLPTNIQEVRCFLALKGYYEKLKYNYVYIAHPLNCLTWKSQPFIWTPECQSSFNMLHSWCSLICSLICSLFNCQTPTGHTYCSWTWASFAIQACLLKPPTKN